MLYAGKGSVQVEDVKNSDCCGGSLQMRNPLRSDDVELLLVRQAHDRRINSVFAVGWRCCDLAWFQHSRGIAVARMVASTFRSDEGKEHLRLQFARTIEVPEIFIFIHGAQGCEEASLA